MAVRLAEKPPIEDDLHACTMCGYCVPVCPPYREIGFESAAPRGKVYFMREFDKRGLGVVDWLLRRKTLPDAEFSKAVFECTACGACENICMADIPFDGLWQDVKEWMVDSGLGMPEQAPVFERVRETHNIYGEPHERRGAWLPKEARNDPSPEVVYWVGCAASYRKQRIAESVVKILNAARVRYRILGTGEWCSGAPLANMGFGSYVKKELMPRNIEAVAETGAKILVTACSEDVRAFLKDYRRWGGNPPFSVLHITQYVERLVSDKRLVFTKPLPNLKAAFHDSCAQGRVTGMYDAPRNAMKFLKGLVPLEMFPSKSDAHCSGAGAGFPLVFPDQASSLGAKRLQAAMDVGAQAVVTTCPHAEMHFEDIAKRQNIPLQTLDIAEVLAQAL
ncbi:MAG: (Fe-S)-binding protein [Methanobacteriota archaeon]|nr:MAG: (Fe-S)-binding protein [Euryarchaeota archaeon]